MRISIRLIVLVIVVFGWALHARGQQCGQTFAYLQECGGPNNCDQNVALNGFESNEYPVFLSYFLVACCESYFPSWYPSGGVCDNDQLKDPKVRRLLTELATRQEILVANCVGQYQLFNDLPHNSVDSKELLFSSRRPLF